MKFIQGTDRKQTALFPVSLDEALDQDNEVRLIDLFVGSLDMAEFGFKSEFIENGRPAYHPADLLRLFIYGYLNKIRSSRDLEKECRRNIEVMWLMKSLCPDHNTISNFRRDNSEAIKKVFRATVQIAKHFELIGGKIIAGDSTKMRAQNSKKNNFNEKKIQRHLEYIDSKIEEYSNALSTADKDTRKELKETINDQQQRRHKYEELRTQLEESGEVQISTSDPDSRQLITRNNITEVGYNIQTTVDEKHNIPLDYKVTNENDSKAMGSMVKAVSEVIGSTDFAVLYDKGFHTGSEIKVAQELGVETIVAIPDISSASMAPDPAYNVSQFNYNAQNDEYACPQGQVLRTNGRWYKKDRNGPGRKHTEPIQVRHYKTPACKTCSVINSCTKNTRGRGRVIERSEYADYIEQNKKNVEAKQQLYRRRQAIVEHPYGVLKRQWGFYYVLTKRGMERASADVGLMFVAYNLRRLITILGFKKFRRYLEQQCSVFFGYFSPFKAKRANLKVPNNPYIFLVLISNLP